MLRDRFAKLLWGQFRKPSGVFGRIIGNDMARGNEYAARWTVSLLDIQPESRVLEIGFGPGVAIRYASEKATKGIVVGIDHSQTMVQAALRRNAEAIRAGRIELKQGDVSCLPYPDESFHKVFSIHSIYFWARPADGLRELRRVLKTGGLLAITIEPKDQWTKLQRRQTSVLTLYSGTDLAAMISSAGFRNAGVEDCPEQDKFAGQCVLGVK